MLGIVFLTVKAAAEISICIVFVTVIIQSSSGSRSIRIEIITKSTNETACDSNPPIFFRIA